MLCRGVVEGAWWAFSGGGGIEDNIASNFNDEVYITQQYFWI